MRRNPLLLLGLVAALALPASAVAKPTKTDRTNAAKECKLLRGTTDESREAFAALYKNFGACVSEKAREEARERKAARREAREACEGLKGRAFGKCVSKAMRKIEKAEDAEDRQEIVEFKNAAKACAAEREELGEKEFGEKYGTNKNRKNAFGKCVSSHADNGEEADE